MIVLVALLVGIVATVIRNNYYNPTQNGKRLSQWMRRFEVEKSQGDIREALENIRQLGSKANPRLLSMMRAEDSSFWVALDGWLPFDLIDEHAYSKRSRALQVCKLLGHDFNPPVSKLLPLLESTDERVRGFGAQLLSRRGKAASGAIPDLLKHLNDLSPWVRGQSAIALGCIGESPDAVVPRLVALLDDIAESLEPTAYSIRPPTVRRMAIIALRGFKERAASSVARLLELFKEHPLERPYIAQSIKVIAPQRIGDLLPTLCEQIQSKDEIQRGAAATALQILGESAKPAVPAMLQAISMYETNRAKVFRALCQVDQTRADAFLPMISSMLQADDPIRQVEGLDMLLGIQRGKEAVVPLVQTLTNSANSDVRFSARLLLQSIESDGLVGLPSSRSDFSH